MASGKTDLTSMEGLLIKVRTLDELYAYEFENINRATVKYLVRQPSFRKAPFTYEWFLKVHREMFDAIWSWAGKVRDEDLNIGVGKTEIRSLLKALEGDLQFWLSANTNSEEVAARLHHRLVWIHPFKNGNGRWARLITNIFQRQQELPLIQWPEKKLIEQNNLRTKYLTALKKADRGGFSELMALQREWMK